MIPLKTVFYFGYGANMSKDYLQKRRRVFPSETHHGVLNGYKLVMNMEGPNFLEPSFANIMKSSNEKIEGILSKITEKELKQIVNSEGVNYEITPRTAKSTDTQVASSATPGVNQYKITTTMDYLKVPDNFVVTVSAPSGTFAQQEDFTASQSGTTGEISNIVLDFNNQNVVTGAVLTMAVPTGYLAIGETITGNTSGATAIVASYTTS